MSRDQKIPVNNELWLTPLSTEHRQQCLELLNNREIERRMLTVPYPYGETEFDSFLEIAAAEREEHGCDIHFSVIHQTEGMVGGCGFHDIETGHKVEVGYWLGQPYWGRGFMTSVVAAACDYAVKMWNVKRIAAHVFDGNERSARVLEKNGFQCEGLLHKFDRKGDDLINTRMFAKIVD
jgi:[ribosomal protein S5]-alanine N-acetyltransferase